MYNSVGSEIQSSPFNPFAPYAMSGGYPGGYGVPAPGAYGPLAAQPYGYGAVPPLGLGAGVAPQGVLGGLLGGLSGGALGQVFGHPQFGRALGTALGAFAPFQAQPGAFGQVGPQGVLGDGLANVAGIVQSLPWEQIIRAGIGLLSGQGQSMFGPSAVPIGSGFLPQSLVGDVFAIAQRLPWEQIIRTGLGLLSSGQASGLVPQAVGQGSPLAPQGLFNEILNGASRLPWADIVRAGLSLLQAAPGGQQGQQHQSGMGGANAHVPGHHLAPWMTTAGGWGRPQPFTA